MPLFIGRDAPIPTCRIPQFQFSECKALLDTLKSEKSDVDKLIIYRIKLRGITLNHFYLR